MTNQERDLSRRQWLGLLSTASVGTGLFAAASARPATPENGTTGSERPGSTLQSPTLPRSNGVYNVRDFGARGDGKTLDTAAVQAAIDACHRDQGGIVLVPAGIFAIGTVELKSNVTLRIAAQGILLGTDDGRQYHAADAIPLRGDSTLGDGNVGLLYAVDAENITVEGPGTIDGQGHQFLSPQRGVPPPAGISGARRPYHLLFYRCRNLIVRDIFLKDSAFHSVRVIQSKYAVFSGIHIHGRVVHNNDGFHFISSQYVHLTNCDVESQDDACALFGSCKFVTVSNCTFSTRWSVFRFGGGEAENITVSNCIIYEAYGCPIKMRCGPGSRFENISFSNIIMNKVTGPISIGNGPRSRRNQTPGELGQPAGQTNAPPATETNTEADASVSPGIVRNISFDGIQATIVKPVQLADASFSSNYNPGEVFSAVTLNAFDQAFLENIRFNNVHFIFPGGGTAEQGAVRDVPKVAGEYYTMGVPPAWAIFARNVRGLTMQAVRFELAAEDARPALVFDQVADAAVNGLSVQGDKSAESALRLIDARDTLISAPRLLKPAAVFLQVEGKGNENIVVDGGDLTKAEKALVLKNGATEAAVKVRA